MEEVNSSKILEFLKGKYLKTPSKQGVSTSSNNESPKKDNLPMGEENEYDGEDAENEFLMKRLDKIQSELVKYLNILKSKIS